MASSTKSIYQSFCSAKGQRFTLSAAVWSTALQLKYRSRAVVLLILSANPCLASVQAGVDGRVLTVKVCSLIASHSTHIESDLFPQTNNKPQTTPTKHHPDVNNQSNPVKDRMFQRPVRAPKSKQVYFTNNNARHCPRLPFRSCATCQGAPADSGWHNAR